MLRLSNTKGTALRVKKFLIAAYLVSDYQSVWSRVSSLGLSPALGLYLALFAVVAAALFLSASIRNDLLRCLLAAVLSLSSMFQHSVETVANGALTFDAFLNLYNARGNVNAALAQHGAALPSALVPGLLLFAGLALPPARSRIPRRAALAAPFATLFLLSAIFYERGGDGARGLPAAFTPAAYAAIMAAGDIMKGDGPRRDVELARPQRRIDRDLVLIIDESVAGNYLDINNPAGVESGLRAPPPSVAVANYGYAASIHTCSANTNLALRFGGTRGTYQKMIAGYPSIWRYAERAGLRTVYIDAQSTGGELQNMMTPAERAEIDEFIQFDGVATIHRDMAAAASLARLMNNNRSEFIFLNKQGAHFPVHDKFPDAMFRYRPALERGRHSAVSWTSDRTGFHGWPREWALYRNSYRNTLLWTVGEFFRRLFEQADFSRATLIYTSDHGQDLHERGNPGNNSHCGVNPPLEQEGLVPLLVLEGRNNPTLDWQTSLKRNRNGMSHFRIFPTLLQLMGYDSSEVRPLYGPPLTDPEPDDFSFNILFETRLGRDPEWQPIHLDKVISPPSSDYRGE